MKPQPISFSMSLEGPDGGKIDVNGSIPLKSYGDAFELLQHLLRLTGDAAKLDEVSDAKTLTTANRRQNA